MLNNSDYSLADIATATNGNNGSAWWIILLFLFAFGGFGGGLWGNNSALTQAELAQDTNYSRLSDAVSAVRQHQYDNFYNTSNQLANVQTNLSDQFDGLNRGIAELGYSLQAGINGVNYNNLQNTYTIGTQLNNIGTKIDSGFCALNYNLASSVRDIVDNQNMNTRNILEFLTKDKIETLQNENQTLRLAASQATQNNYLISQLRPSPIPAYIVENPYASSTGGTTTTG